jgi:hypothetical protein
MCVDIYALLKRGEAKITILSQSHTPIYQKFNVIRVYFIRAYAIRPYGPSP